MASGCARYTAGHLHLAPRLLVCAQRSFPGWSLLAGDGWAIAVAVPNRLPAGSCIASRAFLADPIPLRQPHFSMSDLLFDEHSLWREQISRAEAAFLKNVSRFVAEAVAPYASAWEEAEALPREIFAHAGRLGLMGMVAPKKYGGQGLGYVAYALAIREIAKHQGALAIDIAAHNALACGHILRSGTATQLHRVFPRLANGEWLGAWALTEPEAGSDSAGVQTTAVPRADGTWELNGFKRYITLGRTADVLVVMAVSGATEAEGQRTEVQNRRTDGERKNVRKEISAFLVDKSQIKPLRKVPTCGLRASETSELKLVKARGELLGERGGGQAAALACLDKGRIGVAAVSLGLARAALDAALKHALTRKQFGKRLADFQAIQFMLADCETELRAAELLVFNAAILGTRGVRHGKESSMAKLYASEAASRICDRALQIHGGYGYTRDIPVERFWRDARLSEIGEGSSEVQRIVISRALLKSADEALAAAR
jgi:alkylation response protein AidB-like acyl-CoA dehydrogenase